MINKIRGLSVFFILILVSANMLFAAEVVDRIVAVVNDDIIRLSELNKAVAGPEAQIRSKQYSTKKESEEIYKLRMDILNNLIDEKLADQEIRNAGIFVGERDIDNAIEQVKAMNYYSDEDLRMALAAGNISMTEYRKEIKQQILRNKLVNVKIKSKIIITDSDILAYYNAHPDKYLPKHQYLLSNIMLRYPAMADARAREAVHERMLEIRKMLKDGASFAETAKKYSEAVNAADGGRLGQFSLDELAENIQTVVKGRKTGEISDITKSDQGLQIFHIDALELSKGRPLDAVKDEIRQLLYEDSVNQKFQTWIKQLRENSYIHIIR